MVRLKSSFWMGFVFALSLVLPFCGQVRAEDVKEVAVDKEKEKKKKAVFFSLSGIIQEQHEDNEMAFSLFGDSEKKMGVRELVRRLKLAADTEDVAGVFLHIDEPHVAWEYVAEIREAILKIKAAGKPVVASAEEMRAIPYLIASAATKIYVNSGGDLFIAGFHARQWFLKGTLDKVGLQADILHVGTHKGAGEPLTLNAPSKESQEMMNWLLDDWYAQLCEQLGKARGKDAAAGKAWIEKGPYTAKQALEAGLIDGVISKVDAVTEFYKMAGLSTDIKFESRFGMKKSTTVDFGNIFALFQVFGEMFKGPPKEDTKKPVVGILYAEGAITSGVNDDGIGSDTLVHDIDKAIKDTQIKIVVMRVNSPGGSALASETIHNALLRLKAHKPLVVSMGPVTASGGYYISAPAERIFAHPTSLVGSIGVVGGKIISKEFYDWIGMTSFVYDRGGPRAGLMDTMTKFSPAEREWLTTSMNEVYETFAQRVKEGRGTRLKDFDKVTGGRVFTGRQSLGNGLVDELGGLNQAIQWSAEKLALKDFDVRVINKRVNPMVRYLQRLSGQEEVADGTSSVTATLADAAQSKVHSVMPPGIEEKFKAALSALSGVDKSAAEVLVRQSQMLRLLSEQKPLLWMPFEITK